MASAKKSVQTNSPVVIHSGQQTQEKYLTARDMDEVYDQLKDVQNQMECAQKDRIFMQNKVDNCLFELANMADRMRNKVEKSELSLMQKTLLGYVPYLEFRYLEK